MNCHVCGVMNADVAEKCRKCNALLRRPEPPQPSLWQQIRAKLPPPMVLAGIGVGVLVLAMVVSLALNRSSAQPESVAAAAAPARALTFEQQIAADIRALEQRQAQEIADAQLDALYSTASFATREAIQAWILAVQEMAKRSASHEREWSDLRQQLGQRIQGASKPPEQVAALGKQVDRALAESEALQKKVGAATKQWAHATLDLYDYAQSNAEHIDARGPEIQVRHYEVATGFNGRLSRARRLQQEMQKLSAKAIETRQARLREAGVELAP